MERQRNYSVSDTTTPKKEVTFNSLAHYLLFQRAHIETQTRYIVNQTTLFNKRVRNTKHLCKNVHTIQRQGLSWSKGKTRKPSGVSTKSLCLPLDICNTQGTTMHFPLLNFVLLSNTENALTQIRFTVLCTSGLVFRTA